MNNVAVANTNEDDILSVDNNNDDDLAVEQDNDEALHMNPDNAHETMDDAFTYTTHQLMVAKLLSMLDAWNAPNYCFQQIVEWYEEAREKMFPFLATRCHARPTSR